MTIVDGGTALLVLVVALLVAAVFCIVLDEVLK
jgi:hypothetical protein